MTLRIYRIKAISKRVKQHHVDGLTEKNSYACFCYYCTLGYSYQESFEGQSYRILMGPFIMSPVKNRHTMTLSDMAIIYDARRCVNDINFATILCFLKRHYQTTLHCLVSHCWVLLKTSVVLHWRVSRSAETQITTLANPKRHGDCAKRQHNAKWHCDNSIWWSTIGCGIRQCEHYPTTLRYVILALSNIGSPCRPSYRHIVAMSIRVCDGDITNGTISIP